MDAELGTERGNLISSASETENYGLVGGTSNAASPLSLADIFDQACPHYLAMGMTWDEYWHGDPWAVRAYREAYKAKRESESFIAWLHGMYVRDAIASCFTDKKNPYKYPEKPYELFETEHKPDSDGERPKPKTAEEREVEKSDMGFNAYMTAWMSHINKKFARKEGKEDGGCTGN